MAMMMPAALGALIAEAFAIRSWVFHVANGGLFCLDWPQNTMVEMNQPYNFLQRADHRDRSRHRGGLRLLGGGRSWNAGFWKPVFAPRPVSQAD